MAETQTYSTFENSEPIMASGPYSNDEEQQTSDYVEDLRMLITNEALDEDRNCFKTCCSCCMDLTGALTMEERVIKLVCGFIRENAKQSGSIIPSDIYRECIKFTGSAKEFESKLLKSAAEKRREKCRYIIETLSDGDEFDCERKISLIYCKCLREIPEDRYKLNTTTRRSLDIYLYSYLIGYLYIISSFSIASSRPIIIIITILAYMALTSINIYRIIRLWYAFRGGYTAFSRCTKRIYIISAVFIATFICASILTLFMGWDIMDRMMLYVMISIGFFMKIIYDISLMRVFATKLLMVIKVHHRRNPMLAAPAPAQFDEHDLHLIELIAKNVVLDSIGILCGDLLIPMVITLGSLDILSLVVAILLVILLSCIEMVTVVLLFSFNEKFYNVVCKICHRGCNQCCIKVATNSIN